MALGGAVKLIDAALASVMRCCLIFGCQLPVVRFRLNFHRIRLVLFAPCPKCLGL
jgi:hypothetical protein